MCWLALGKKTLNSIQIHCSIALKLDFPCLLLQTNEIIFFFEMFWMNCSRCQLIEGCSFVFCRRQCRTCSSSSSNSRDQDSGHSLSECKETVQSVGCNLTRSWQSCCQELLRTQEIFVTASSQKHLLSYFQISLRPLGCCLLTEENLCRSSCRT